MNKCEHGSSPWVSKELSGMLMNAPVDFCICCGTTYYYCDEGGVGPDGGWGKSWTKGRCGACGGKYEFWDTRKKEPTIEMKANGDVIITPTASKKTINQLCQECNEAANSKGFSENTPGECIALMHSELSEALEEYRKGQDYWNIYYKSIAKGTKPEGLVVELADAVIRILHFCGKYKLDLEKAIEIKMEYNKTRPHKHGGKVI